MMLLSICVDVSGLFLVRAAVKQCYYDTSMGTVHLYEIAHDKVCLYSVLEPKCLNMYIVK